MEAGRAVVRGLVTPDRTTTVASTHRIYGITEKSAMGDGIVDANAVFAALESRSKRLISFDMQGSPMSTTALSARCCSDHRRVGCAAVPACTLRAGDHAIRRYGQDQSGGLRCRFRAARTRSPMTSLMPPSAGPTTETGKKLDERIKREFPAHLHGLLQEGIERTLDYQDGDYAKLYLDRLREIQDSGGYALTAAVARHLALWMTYEDVIRVARI